MRISDCVDSLQSIGKNKQLKIDFPTCSVFSLDNLCLCVYHIDASQL